MADSRQRLVSFVYACATVSLAAGFFGALNTKDAGLRHIVVAGTSLAAWFGLAILAWRLDR